MHDVLTALEERLDEPTAKGLAQAVTRAIRSGALKGGDRLPPIRAVAHELCLSPTTVNAAWALLQRSGTIHADGRRGTTIALDRTPGSSRYRHALLRQNDFDLDLSNGVPDPELLPNLVTALDGITSAASPGGYLGKQVLPELVDVLRSDWPYEAEAFTIVDGAMDAVELVARAIVRHGDRVIVESPTFPPVLDLMEALGAEVIGIPLDSEGIEADALSSALERPASLLFLQPRGQNPTGLSLSPERAAVLGGLVQSAGITVIEDDAAGSVAISQPVSLGGFAPDQTIHTRSFSKSHGSELRLAAVSATEELIGRIEGLRQFAQGWTSQILQQILLNFLTNAEAKEQVERARVEYARRSTILRRELDRRGVRVEGGDGINLWVPVADESAAIMRLASEGIAVTPGTPFASLNTQQQHIRISTGLLRDDYQGVALLIAEAAHTGGWGVSRRE